MKHTILILAAICGFCGSGCVAVQKPDKSFYKITVEGSSMEPLMHDGDKAIAVRKPFTELKTGEDAVRGDGFRYVLHRLKELTPSGWIMQGLANAVPDAERMTESNYFGWVPTPTGP